MNIINLDEVKEEIKERYAELLEPAKKTNTYICMHCGNGTGKDGDGIAPVHNGVVLKCFKCGFSGDIIKYFEQLNGKSYIDTVRELASNLNIRLDEEETHKPTTRANSKPLTAQTSNYTPINRQPLQSDTEPLENETDYTEFFKQCNIALNTPGSAGAEYMTSRGISLITCNKFCVGYCSNWKHPKSPKAPVTARIIIANSKYSYLARAISSDVEKQYQKQKAGKQRIFNYKALQSDDSNIIFIVEGEIDAMSIYEAGAVAIGLGSTSNIDTMLKIIDDDLKAKSKTYIICKDNDDAGTKAEAKLIEEFKKRKIDFISANINGPYKDANEHLQNNRAEFIEAVKRALRKASDPFEADLMSSNIDKMLSIFSDTNSNKALSTGFKNLDNHLSGGIHRGELTLIGAAPSLGKTTLAMQIVENIAQTYTEEEIFIFSLEMSKTQHFAKSLSRLTWETNPNIKDAEQDFYLLQADEIMNGTALKEPLARALAKYKTYANRMHVFDEDRNINYVSETVESYIRKTNKKPIVVIDYIQLLKTSDSKASAIDVIQETISVLNRLKSTYNLAIIGIVAFNRDSNKDGKKVCLDSGRDTSDLEYSADTYLALNFTEWEEDSQENKHSREILARQNMRAMTVKILKKRMGNPYGKIDFIYRANINYFEEFFGNVRQLKADELTPDNSSTKEKLSSKIKYLEKIQSQLEKREIDRYITAEHKRYTSENASQLTNVINNLKLELEKYSNLHDDEEEEKAKARAKTKRI